MSMTRVRATLSLAVLAALSACGGGGNESGSPEELYLSVDAVTVGATGLCEVGAGPQVHIYGGTPPYKLANSVPDAMRLDKAVVQNSGDSFRITFINGICLKNMPITVEDQMGLLARVSVTNGS